MENQLPAQDNLSTKSTDSLLNLATESWRFAKVFIRAISKIDSAEQGRFINQYRYYIKQLEDILSSEGLRLVNLEGQQYDPGTAATALNLDEFLPEDVLVVEQMLEPLIMNDDGILKAGTVLVRKVML